MIVGFTGTRKGMTQPQAEAVADLMYRLFDNVNGNWFHHGDCVGADQEAHDYAQQIGYNIHLHPPLDGRLRAYCELTEFDKCEEPKQLLERDKAIVKACQILIAAPAQATPQFR